VDKEQTHFCSVYNMVQLMVEQKLKHECMKYDIYQFNVNVTLQSGAVGLTHTVWFLSLMC